MEGSERVKNPPCWNVVKENQP